MNVKRAFIIFLLIVLTTATVIGVIALTTGVDNIQLLLSTMLCLDLFALSLLGTGYVLSRGRWRFVMLLSMAASTAAAGLYLFLTCSEGAFEVRPTAQWRWLFVRLATTATALPIAGLLSLTRFRHAVLGSARTFSLTFVFLTAGLICYLDWTVVGREEFRLVGVLIVISLLGVFGLPLLHILASMSPTSETVADQSKVGVTCPRCTLYQQIRPGNSRCARCRLRISIEVEEPRCPKCGYLLYQLTEPRCPECGEALGVDELVSASAPGAPVAPALSRDGDV